MSATRFARSLNRFLSFLLKGITLIVGTYRFRPKKELEGGLQGYCASLPCGYLVVAEDLHHMPGMLSSQHQLAILLQSFHQVLHADGLLELVGF